MASPAWVCLSCLLLHLPHLTAPAKLFEVTSSEEPIIAEEGTSVSLSCQLQPAITADLRQIEWTRASGTEPVTVHQQWANGSITQDPLYKDRTTLCIDRTAKGEVVLQISNVQRLDEGNYTCYFESLSYFNHSSVSIIVAAMGSDPHIGMDAPQEGGVNLSCNTSGWHAEPPMLWWEGSDGQNVTTSSSQGGSGVYSVMTTARVAGNFTCQVKSSLLNRTRTTSVSVRDSLLQQKPPCWTNCSTGLLLFTAVIGFALIYSISKHLMPRGTKEKDLEDGGEPLIKPPTDSQIQSTITQIAPFCQVDVTLDTSTAGPQLCISTDGRRVKFRDPKAVDGASPCVRGSRAFTEGKHFWVVDVGGACKWGIGVAEESAHLGPNFLKDEGVFAVGRISHQYQAFTSPVTQLTPVLPLERVLIYLDQEAGQLSFYHGATQQPIYSYMCRFRKVFPFFWTTDQEHWVTLCPPEAVGHSNGPATTTGQPRDSHGIETATSTV